MLCRMASLSDVQIDLSVHDAGSATPLQSWVVVVVVVVVVHLPHIFGQSDCKMKPRKGSSQSAGEKSAHDR